MFELARVVDRIRTVSDPTVDMELFRRFFLQKPPDRLLEIHERVFVFDCCISTDVLDDNGYKAYMSSIIPQLHDYYPNSSFKVFNFREGDDNMRSQMSYILNEYENMAVTDYPRKYLNHPLLPLQMIHHFLRSSDSWLSSETPKNVLLIHCERGGWLLLAFVLALLVLHKRRRCENQEEEEMTLEMFYNKAPMELLRVLCPLNPKPSQLRYLRCISQRAMGLDSPPSDTPLVLDSVVLIDLPLMDSGNCCSPVVNVYRKTDNGTEVQFSSLTSRRRVRSYPEMKLVKFVIGCRVQGDVVLECAHLCNDCLREEVMFRAMFHTSFVRSYRITLSREEVDIPWGAEDMLHEDFRADVLFLDLEDVSVEEFFEVEESFSDTVHGKRDSDPPVFEGCRRPSDELRQTQQAYTETTTTTIQWKNPDHRMVYEAYPGVNYSTLKKVSYLNDID